MRYSANRLRHFLAVRLLMPSVFAICTLVSPSAASNTMCARSDSARQTFRPRARRFQLATLGSTQPDLHRPPHHSAPESKNHHNCTNYANGTLAALATRHRPQVGPYFSTILTNCCFVRRTVGRACPGIVTPSAFCPAASAAIMCQYLSNCHKSDYARCNGYSHWSSDLQSAALNLPDLPTHDLPRPRYSVTSV